MELGESSITCHKTDPIPRDSVFWDRLEDSVTPSFPGNITSPVIRCSYGVMGRQRRKVRKEGKGDTKRAKERKGVYGNR